MTHSNRSIHNNPRKILNPPWWSTTVVSVVGITTFTYALSVLWFICVIFHTLVSAHLLADVVMQQEMTLPPLLCGLVSLKNSPIVAA